MTQNHEQFDDSDFYAPAPYQNGTPPAMANAAPQAANSTTAIEQSRAVAEVQAALVIAKSQPRSEVNAHKKIMEACQRPSLAETSIYSYKRGGNQVEGPSIRLAETLARYWGNLQYGFRELSRESGVSEIETFCWDLETNTKATRNFQMRHWRDTKSGGYEIKDERDKYELIANFAQRRVRSCILEIIPGDIVESALDQCNQTIKGKSDEPLIDRIKKMSAHFEKLGVSAEMMTDKIQHSLDSMTSIEFRQMAKLYTSIKDGYLTIEEAFGPGQPKTLESTKAAAESTVMTEEQMLDKLIDLLNLTTETDQVAARYFVQKSAAAQKISVSCFVQKATDNIKSFSVTVNKWLAKSADQTPEQPPAASKPEAKPKAKPQADASPITPLTLSAINEQLKVLDTIDHLPTALAEKYKTGDPSELTESEGQEALVSLIAMERPAN